MRRRLIVLFVALSISGSLAPVALAAPDGEPSDNWWSYFLDFRILSWFGAAEEPEEPMATGDKGDEEGDAHRPGDGDRGPDHGDRGPALDPDG